MTHTCNHSLCVHDKGILQRQSEERRGSYSQYNGLLGIYIGDEAPDFGHLKDRGMELGFFSSSSGSALVELDRIGRCPCK